MININYTTFSVVDIITIFSVLLNVVLGIPVSLKKLKSWIRRRALRRLLEFNEVLIHIPSRKTDRIKPVVAMEDYNTYESIRKLLEKYKFGVHIKYISESGDIEIEQDKSNIIICGPKNSHLIKETFTRISGVAFLEDNGVWYFLDEETNNKIYSPMDQEQRKNADIAFLGKLPIYSKPGQSVLLICGIHAIGSLGIGYFLNYKDKIDALLKKVKNKCFYSIIYSEYREEDKKVYSSKIYLEAREII